MLRRIAAVTVTGVMGVIGLAGCSGVQIPGLNSCITNDQAQGLLTRADAKLGNLACAGDDWAVATYTYTTGTGKTNEPGEAILVRYNGTWSALVQGVSAQELCTPVVVEQLKKAPSPIKELANTCG